MTPELSIVNRPHGVHYAHSVLVLAEIEHYGALLTTIEIKTGDNLSIFLGNNF